MRGRTVKVEPEMFDLVVGRVELDFLRMEDHRRHEGVWACLGPIFPSVGLHYCLFLQRAVGESHYLQMELLGDFFLSIACSSGDFSQMLAGLLQGRRAATMPR